MSIKVIEEMPKTARKSNRAMIKADIQEAIDKGISLFEFEGDYNYKYLAGYAREVADEISRRKARDIQRKYQEEQFTYEEKNIRGFYCFFELVWKYDKDWINISSCKGEDRRRVFCKIDDVSYLENRVLEDCKKKLAETREEYSLVDGKWVKNKEQSNG